MIHRMAGDRAHAEELAAETFWKYHKHPPRSAENVAGWLYRTGSRLALDALKKRRRRTHYESFAPRLQPAPAADQNIELAERRERVRATLAAMKQEPATLLTNVGGTGRTTIV